MSEFSFKMKTLYKIGICYRNFKYKKFTRKIVTNNKITLEIMECTHYCSISYNRIIKSHCMPLIYLFEVPI